MHGTASNTWQRHSVATPVWYQPVERNSEMPLSYKYYVNKRTRAQSCLVTLSNASRSESIKQPLAFPSSLCHYLMSRNLLTIHTNYVTSNYALRVLVSTRHQPVVSGGQSGLDLSGQAEVSLGCVRMWIADQSQFAPYNLKKNTHPLILSKFCCKRGSIETLQFVPSELHSSKR